MIFWKSAHAADVMILERPGSTLCLEVRAVSGQMYCYEVSCKLVVPILLSNVQGHLKVRPRSRKKFFIIFLFWNLSRITYVRGLSNGSTDRLLEETLCRDGVVRMRT